MPKDLKRIYLSFERRAARIEAKLDALTCDQPSADHLAYNLSCLFAIGIALLLCLLPLIFALR